MLPCSNTRLRSHSAQTPSVPAAANAAIPLMPPVAQAADPDLPPAPALVTAAPGITLSLAELNALLKHKSTVPKVTFSTSDTSKIKEKLDRGLNNWMTWSEEVSDLIFMHHAGSYIDGSMPCPDTFLDREGAAIWSDNHLAVVAAIRDCCSAEEQVFLRGIRNTHTAWTKLRLRHEHVSPIAQIHLIQKLLGVRYRRTDRFANTSMAIAEDVRRIYSMGAPSKDTFTLMMMMNAMSEELPTVRDHIANCITQSSPSVPYTPEMACMRLEIEQQLIDVAKATSVVTLVATSTKSSGRSSSKRCAACASTGHRKCCTNCKGVGHTVDECFQKGGGREGQRNQILAEKAAKRAKQGGTANAKVTMGKPCTILYDIRGRAYFVDSETNEAFVLQDSAPTPSAPTEFAGLASDAVTPALIRGII